VSRFPYIVAGLLALGLFAAFMSKSPWGENEIHQVAPHMRIDACFSCHFDARDVARNPIGHIASHYAATDQGIDLADTGGLMLCVDCHTSLANYNQYQVHIQEPHRALPGISCQDCHGDLSSTPWERPENKHGREHPRIERHGDKLILRSFNGAELDVTLLKKQMEHDTWSSDLARQAKTEEKHFKKMQCIDCHADWVPTCLGCHDKQPIPKF